MANNNIQQVENYVKDIMVGSEVAHDFFHVDRVRHWALLISEKEKYGYLEMVEIAALLHDIGLSLKEKRSLHGESGAKMVNLFLQEQNFLTQIEIDEICNAIKYHNKNREGEGILLDILRDADMMDLFGAVGIMRAFTSQSSKQVYDTKNSKGETWGLLASDFDKRFDAGIGIGNFIVDHINFQISCYDNLKTETAKILASPLVDFMKSYLEQFEREVRKNS
jgi:uncharacterized protein